MIFEWHPASKTASYESIDPLRKGNHKLLITAIDNAKNKSVKKRNFTGRSGRKNKKRDKKLRQEAINMV